MQWRAFPRSQLGGSLEQKQLREKGGATAGAEDAAGPGGGEIRV